MTDLMGYREKIYKNYATNFQQADLKFDRQAADRWGRAVKAYLKNWLPGNKEAKILELACGGGRLLHLLKQQGYTDLTGVDLCDEQIQLSRQVVDTVVKADALEFLENELQQSKKYDLIIGFDIIEHFSKDEALLFLERCRDLLNPAGRLILKTPNANSPWGLTHRYNDMTHEICFNPACLAKVLSMLGFKTIESRETGPVVYGVKSLARFILWKLIRVGLMLWNLAETGGNSSGVFTRVFLISGTV